MAASVSTRVVSWNEAAEMNDSVDSDALVMPSKLSLLRVQRRVSGGTAKQVKLSSRFSGAVCRSRGASRAHLRTAGCSGNSAKGHIDGVIVRKEVDKILVDETNALAIDHAKPVGVRPRFAEINFAVERVVASANRFVFHTRTAPVSALRVR